MKKPEKHNVDKIKETNKDNKWLEYLVTGKTDIEPAIQPKPKPKHFSSRQQRAIGR